MAHELSRDHNCIFTDTDKFSDNTFVPLPHVRPKDFFAYADDLEKKAPQAQAPPQKQMLDRRGLLLQLRNKFIMTASTSN